MTLQEIGSIEDIPEPIRSRASAFVLAVLDSDCSAAIVSVERLPGPDKNVRVDISVRAPSPEETITLDVIRDQWPQQGWPVQFHQEGRP